MKERGKEGRGKNGRWSWDAVGGEGRWRGRPASRFARTLPFSLLFSPLHDENFTRSSTYSCSKNLHRSKKKNPVRDTDNSGGRPKHKNECEIPKQERKANKNIPQNPEQLPTSNIIKSKEAS